MYTLIGNWISTILGTFFFTVWVLNLLYSAIWAFFYYADKKERSIPFLKKDTIWERIVISNRFKHIDEPEDEVFVFFVWAIPLIPIFTLLFISIAWPLMIAALPLWFLFYVLRTMLDVHKMKNPQQP